MRSPAARMTLLAIGVVVTLVGLVWTLQGAGVLKGSIMTGSTTWLSIGILCLAVGAFAIFSATRGRRGPRARDRRR